MTWARGVTKTTPPGHFPAPLSRLSTKRAPNIIYIGNNGSEEHLPACPGRWQVALRSHYSQYIQYLARL